MVVSTERFAVSGAGLGLRRDFLDEFSHQALPAPVSFLEVAPENWMGLGGRYGKAFAALSEAHPFVCHGLSLSIGGPAPLDKAFIGQLKQFLDRHNIRCYSEHLSWCAGDAHLYDLLPIPFTEEAVAHVAGRVRQVQDMLERPLVLENVSYYAVADSQLSEIDFINAVLSEADCQLLLDVNNIVVNATNHDYEPLAFLQALPGQRIAYGHVAGHSQEDTELLIDTHGAPVSDPVWGLLAQAYQLHGPFPTLLERDFNLPPLPELLAETAQITRLQDAWQ